MAWRRFVLGQKYMTLEEGGAVVAFVGPPATGKTTLSFGIEQWLTGDLQVFHVHAGKPPRSWVTFLPSMAIPLARVVFPRHGTVVSEVAAQHDENYRYSLLFLVRKLMLAYDRRRLLRRMFKESRNGRLVLSDRYPSDNPGAVDGRSFPDDVIARETSPLKRWLMKCERGIYSEVPPPDIVVELKLPADVAVSRNRERHRTDAKSADYVRQRHDMEHAPCFNSSRVIPVSSDKDLGETLAEVKSRIWSLL